MHSYFFVLKFSFFVFVEKKKKKCNHLSLFVHKTLATVFSQVGVLVLVGVKISQF